MIDVGWLRRAGWAGLLLLLPCTASADARLTLLMDVLRIGEVVAIMREEGLDYADDVDSDMLTGQGGGFWQAQTGQIYDVNRMTETVRAALEAGLDAPARDTAVAFFDTALGQQIVELENASRAAMQDEQIEEAARAGCRNPATQDVAHLALIDRFIAGSDLIERNVAGALSSNYRFYEGLVDGEMLALPEAEILAQVYGQEDEIRRETEDWLCGYLLLAYRPLPLKDLLVYVEFYETDTGRALNTALFDGYETMYRGISYALGRAVALNSAGQDI